MNENFVYRPNCELCGSDEKVFLLSREFTDPVVWNFLDVYYESRINKSDLTGAKYEIVKCSECDFIWQAYVLNEKLMEKLYNVWISPEYSLKKKKCADISFFSRYASEVQAIAFLLSKNPFEIDVLDFGMGWGYWCLMAKAFGYNVSGFEISKERIEFARKNGIDVIDDFSKITTRKFDFINTEQVFEHIVNPIQTLRPLLYSLKKEGIIRISVPNGRYIEKELANPRWKASKNPIHPLEHINCFTHQTLVKFGELTGLKLIQSLRLSDRFNLKSKIKSLITRKYHKQDFGTTLYFKKV